MIAGRTSELLLMGKKLDNVVVGASHQNKAWQVNISSDQATGYATWSESGSGQDWGASRPGWPR